VSAFGLVLHRQRGADLAAEVAAWLTERDHEVRLSPADAARIGMPELGVVEGELAIGLDLLVSLGGDGTMLHAADLAVEEGVPVMGVNLGNLGYLTEVERGELKVALKRFLSGQSYTVQDRMRLGAVVHRADGSVEASSALNDVVVEKSEPGRTVRLDVSLDGRPFTTWVADGLVLSTPTGSTAYSFSVRGPIVDPVHQAIIMAPVAPHMLFDRSMVLRPDCEVRVTAAGDRPAGVSIDGRPGSPLQPGESVVCRAADRPSRFVSFPEHDFHAVLRSKFGLKNR
jgi:NAD+ kinase